MALICAGGPPGQVAHHGRSVVSALVTDLPVSCGRSVTKANAVGTECPVGARLASRGRAQIIRSAPDSALDSAVHRVAVGRMSEQARETYGRDQGDAIIRDFATIKILFGGEGKAEDLRELGDLLGERDEEVTSVAHQPGGSVLWDPPPCSATSGCARC